MDERNEMQEDGFPPVPPPVLEAGAGRPYRRKLIRPEREEPRGGGEESARDAAAGEQYGNAEPRRDARTNGLGENGLAEQASPEPNMRANGQAGNGISERGATADEPSAKEAQSAGVPAAGRSGANSPGRKRSGAGRGRYLSRRSRTASRSADSRADDQTRGRANAPAIAQERARMNGHANAPANEQTNAQADGKANAPASIRTNGQADARNNRRQGQRQVENKQPIPASLDELKPLLEREAGLNASFDVVLREMTFGGRRTALFYMNGLIHSAILTEVLVRLSYLTSEDIDADALKLFFETYVPAVQVTKSESFDDMLDAVLAGNAAMFIDRERAALIIDVKMFPDRTPEEPSLERVVRGSRDGFVETLMTNVSLIRRRLRDKDLRYELIRVGARTKTDVCIAYIRDIADPNLVEEVKRKIGQVNVYGLPLADKQLEETTVNRGWHPYPLVRYSERPDVVAAQLLEGSVAVLTDTTPSVMMLPTTFFDLTQHAEENRQTPFIGTYLRWVRYIGILFSLFLMPLWFLLVLKPELKPPALDFLGPQQMGRIPLFLQFLLAEIGVDLMRMAAVHTPSPLSTAMSLIAAILIGDIAVKTGLFNNEVILYMALAAIGMFATPNYELGLANRIVRLALIIAVAAFGVPGFVVGTALFIVLLACTRSFNRPYLWPFIPFDGRSLAALLVRPPELQNRKRNPLLKPQQLDRLPDSREKG
jgi:stage V sporulation protein AF